MQQSNARQLTAIVGALSTLVLFAGCGGGLGSSSAADTSKALSGQSAVGVTSTSTVTPGAGGAGDNATAANSPGVAAAADGSDASTTPAVSSNVVPRSEITMGPVATAPTSTYSQQTAGTYSVVNNTWGVKTLPRGWSQQTGISELQADGSVAFATKWDFPYYCGHCEVLSYPEVVYGRGAGIAPVGGAKLPKKVGEVSTLVSQYSHIEGTASGLGHVTYDIWTARSAESMAGGQRLAEIMLPVEPFGGYGVPKYPPAAAAGRAGQLASGRNPRGYVERTEIGGAAYDVYYNAAGALMPWAFIVFQPVVAPGRGGHVMNWMPILNYMKGKNWISANDYLANIEFGVEAISTQGGTKGDLTISGFKVTAE